MTENLFLNCKKICKTKSYRAKKPFRKKKFKAKRDSKKNLPKQKSFRNK